MILGLWTQLAGPEGAQWKYYLVSRGLRLENTIGTASLSARILLTNAK